MHRDTPDLLFQTWPESDLAGFSNSNPTGAKDRFAEYLFWDHRTIRLRKLMASTMLSAAIKRQYSSVLPLLCHCLPVLTKLEEWQSILYFFIG